MKRPRANRTVDPLEISLRAFVTPKSKVRPKFERSLDQGPSDYTLIFDTETKTDSSQALRFGTYQVRKENEIFSVGIFFDPEMINSDEIELLRVFAAEQNLDILPVTQFIEEIFYGIGYDLRATIVGFNLPFDLSRLAIKQSSARGKFMKGGFTFKISEQKHRPNLQIKNLSGRAAFIQFVTRMGRFDTRGMRKRLQKALPRRGYFVDANTLAAALLSIPFSLASLADHLKTPTRKAQAEEHGGPLTKEYIQYAVQDVQVTWECYQALIAKFQTHNFRNTLPHQIYSEAGIGKAYLKELNLLPLRESQPDFPNELFGKIISTYYGGRSEIHYRREITRIAYCDFLSMYPTACTLMGLWQFMIAKGINWKNSTKETKVFLDQISFADLQRPDTWRKLTTIVKVKPDDDLFPVRAEYGRQETIGLNYLTRKAPPLWFTLADCIASKLLTGKCPKIIEAISFEPMEPQEQLKSVDIAGNSDYRINPKTDDFFKRLIDLRNETKHRIKTAPAEEKAALESEQLALKIIANSTSYGILIEQNVEDLSKPEERICYGYSGKPFSVFTDKAETPGRYFNPLLATLITGAARLMLAIAQTLTKANGLEWAFCDTDSMAIAKTDGVDTSFNSRVEIIQNWFNPLNPYSDKGPLFKLENVNLNPETNEIQPLYFLGISAKRYVLFNLSQNGEINIRKASAHGLGHLMPPYTENDPPKSIPAPKITLKEIGVERWQYDLWHQIIQAHLDGNPDQVELDYHPALNLPAASRYGATTPPLCDWFKSHNANRLYRDQVRAFNFMVAFQAWPPEFQSVNSQARNSGKSIQDTTKPVSAFDKDLSRAAKNTFDRETGSSVDSKSLKTYREVLAQYHLSPELKFRNGKYLDKGKTERRYIEITSIRNIGKESNKWEEQYVLGDNPEFELDYGIATQECASLVKILRKLNKTLGQRELAFQLGISRHQLSKLLGKRGIKYEATIMGPIAGAVTQLNSEANKFNSEQKSVLQKAKKEINRIGLSEFSKRLKLDTSNLGKVIRERRKLNAELLKILISYFRRTSP